MPKIYRVDYSSISLYSLLVTANSEEEAKRIAEDTDGSEFEPVPTGDWEFYDITCKDEVYNDNHSTG